MQLFLKQAFAVGIITLGAQGCSIAPSDPKGDGEASAMACRAAESAARGRAFRPEVCLTNAQWSALHARKWTISADGEHVVKHDNPVFGRQDWDYSDPLPPPSQYAVPDWGNRNAVFNAN